MTRAFLLSVILAIMFPLPVAADEPPSTGPCPAFFQAPASVSREGDRLLLSFDGWGSVTIECASQQCAQEMSDLGDQASTPLGAAVPLMPNRCASPFAMVIEMFKKQQQETFVDKPAANCLALGNCKAEVPRILTDPCIVGSCANPFDKLPQILEMERPRQ